MFTASAGATRTPDFGSLPMALDCTVIQAEPDFSGSVNGPMKTAPACRLITSPGWASFKAAWKLPPDDTLMVLPGESMPSVCTNACGIAGVELCGTEFAEL